jgi:hypothetical protein
MQISPSAVDMATSRRDGALVTQEGALNVINAGATPMVDDK